MLQEKDSLDPVIEHRYWCPWIQLSGDKAKQSGDSISPLNTSLTCHGQDKTATSLNSGQTMIEKCQAWIIVAKLLSNSVETDDNFLHQMKKVFVI